MPPRLRSAGRDGQRGYGCLDGASSPKLQKSGAGALLGGNASVCRRHGAEGAARHLRHSRAIGNDASCTRAEVFSRHWAQRPLLAPALPLTTAAPPAAPMQTRKACSSPGVTIGLRHGQKLALASGGFVAIHCVLRPVRFPSIDLRYRKNLRGRVAVERADVDAGTGASQACVHRDSLLSAVVLNYYVTGGSLFSPLAASSSGPTMSSGSGNTMVEFLSAAMTVSVSR